MVCYLCESGGELVYIFSMNEDTLTLFLAGATVNRHLCYGEVRLALCVFVCVNVV